jgi:arginyl-tRNA synthetase
MLPVIKKQIISLMQAALAEIAKERSILDPLPEPHVERPKVVEHGDLATNIAMQLSKAWKANPRELAQVFVEKLMAQAGAQELIASAEIAGPGFINLRLTQKARLQVIGKVFADGNCYGQQAELGKKVLVEFVSANPTGPLHVGHGRQAALGDALSNILNSRLVGS